MHLEENYTNVKTLLIALKCDHVQLASNWRFQNGGILGGSPRWIYDISMLPLPLG